MELKEIQNDRLRLMKRRVIRRELKRSVDILKSFVQLAERHSCIAPHKERGAVPRIEEQHAIGVRNYRLLIPDG